MIWFRHDAAGRITTTGSCQDGAEHYFRYPGETLVVGVDASLDYHWFDIDAQQLRPRATPVITVDGLTLTDIPAPSALHITGPVALSTRVEHDTLELSFDVPGTYTLRFEPEHPQWTEAAVTIEVAA